MSSAPSPPTLAVVKLLRLGHLLRRPPVEDKQVTHQSHIPRVEGTKASVLEEFEHMWAKGLLCHARYVYMFLRITPPIAKCFVHAHVLSPFTTDREVFVPCTCCLPSSPPIVKCYFHLHVYSRFTSDREALSPHTCRTLFVHVFYLSIHLRCLLPRYFILFRCFPRASGANQVRMSVYLSSRERQEM